MPDYKEMYLTLFRSMTKAMAIMQQAQQATEEMYLSAALPSVRAVEGHKTENNRPGAEQKTTRSG